jgi:hypothetical protein
MAKLDSWGIDAVKLDECAGEGDPSPVGIALYDQALNPPNTSKSIFGLWTITYLTSGWPSYCNCPQNAQGALITTYSGGSSNAAFANLLYAVQDQINGIWNYYGWAAPTPSLYGPYHFKNSSVLCSSNPTNVILAGFALLTAMLNNPMLIDFPPTNNLSIWTNQEIIAIMQDEACRMAVNVTNYSGGVQVWVKSLGIPEKCRAVCYFNTNAADTSICASVQDIGYIGKVRLRDVINHVDLGTVDTALAATVPAGSCLLWLVTPLAGVAPTVSGSGSGLTADSVARPSVAVDVSRRYQDRRNGMITNGGLVWYVTHGTPAANLPDGSIATTTDGRFFVRSNSTWVRH